MKSTYSSFGLSSVSLSLIALILTTDPGQDQDNKAATTHLDIKSPELVEILRRVLANVKAVILREDKPSVGTILFQFSSIIQKLIIVGVAECVVPVPARS